MLPEIVQLPDVPPAFVSRAAAAEHLGIDTRTLDRMIADGEVPAYRVGRKLVRLRWADVEALLVPIDPVTT